MSTAEPTSGRRFQMNPVLEREIKERMRSARASVILIGYLSLMAVIMYLTYRFGQMGLSSRIGEMSGGGPIAAASLGRTMFEVLLLFLIGLVAFIAPGATSGAIAGERERGTLQLLQVTLLKPRSIILGKLASSLAFIFLLLLAAMPLFTVPLILGGVTPGQATKGFLVVAVMAIFIACCGIYMSTIARRSMFATLGTYAMTFFLLAGTLVTYGAERIARSNGHLEFTDRPLSTYLNPFAATADAVVDPESSGMLPSPFSIVRNMVPAFIPGQGFSEPETIADGEGLGVQWQLTWRGMDDGNNCMGFQTFNGGGESCGPLPAEDALALETMTTQSGTFIYGAAGKNVAKLRIDMEEGDPVTVKRLKVNEKIDASFFVASIETEQRAKQITGLDGKDKELESQSLEGVIPPDINSLQGGVVVGKPGFPMPMPMPAVPPPDLPVSAPDVDEVAPVAAPAPVADAAPADPSPEMVARAARLAAAGAAAPAANAVDQPAPAPSPETASDAPAAAASEPAVAVDLPAPMPFPVPMPIGRGFAGGVGFAPGMPVQQNSLVWEIHMVVMLALSVVLVVLSTLRLTRPGLLRIFRRSEV